MVCGVWRVRARRTGIDSRAPSWIVMRVRIADSPARRSQVLSGIHCYHLNPNVSGKYDAFVLHPLSQLLVVEVPAGSCDVVLIVLPHT